jgi:uncharacterized protein YggE
MRIATIASALVSLAALLGCASNGHAQSDRGDLVVRAERAEPTLSVTATGRVAAPADEVVIVLSVVTETQSVDDAVRDNNRISKDVSVVLGRLDLGENAVTTSGFRVTPQYRYDKSNGRKIGIAGYQVSNTVQVKTSKIEQAGKVVEAGINAGANEVLSLSFGLRNEQTTRRAAIKDAVDTAKSEASAAADAAGLRLVGIRSLNIQPDFGRPMYRVASAMRMEADGGGVGETPTNPGLIEVTAQVTIEYRIEPR